MKNRFVPALIVFAVAFLAYFNTLKNEFVWDDHIVIEANTFLDEPSNFKRIISPKFFAQYQAVEGGARPVLLLSFLADAAVWGKEPGGYHLTNVILHGLNSVLVYWLGLFIFLSSAAPTARIDRAAARHAPPVLQTSLSIAKGGAVPAFIAGLLFALHPIHTEAVNVATFRADLLASLFLFLSLLCYIRFRRGAGRVSKVSLIFISGAFYALGLLSKEMAITLPGLALLFDFLVKGREMKEPWKTMWAWRLAALGLYAVIAFWYMGFRAPRSGYHTIENRDVQEASDLRDAVRAFAPSRPSWNLIYEDKWVNFLTMSGVLAEYFRLMVIPYPLHADRAPRLIKSLWSGRVWISWLALSFLAWAAVRFRNRYPAISLGLAWCFITFLPVSNLIPIYNPFAERYLYLISAGACWIFGFLVCEAAKILGVRLDFLAKPQLSSQESQARHLFIVRAGLAGLILLPYGFLTIARNRDWRTDETLFGKKESRPVESARIHYNLGYIRQKEGRIQEAILEYRKALSIHPEYIEAMTNLGALFESRGRIEEALKMYQGAVWLKSKTPLPYDRLGFLLEKKNKPEGAMEAYREALRVDYEFIPARLHLAASLAKAGLVNQAIRELNEAVRIDPSCEDAHYNLGMIYDGLGNFSQAVRELKRVVHLNPRHKDATLNLGVVYHHMGDIASAIRWIGRARVLNPGAPGVYYNFGIVYSDQGRLESALEAFKKAVGIKPDYGDAWYSLGVTYQKLGRVGDALRAYEESLKIEPRRLEVLVNLGGIHEMKGNLDEAKRYLLKAVETAPNRVGPHNNLGNVYLKEGKIQKAIEEYLQALKYIEVLRNAAPTLSNLGMCYYKQGRIQEAMGEWQAAIKAHPGYLEAYYMLARAYKGSGRVEESKSLWRKVLEIDPGNEKALKEFK